MASEPWSVVPAELNTFPINDNDGLCVFCAGMVLAGEPLCRLCALAGLTVEVPHARR